LFEIGVPTAERVREEDNCEPDGVNGRQAVAEALRKKFQRAAKSGRSKQEERMPAVVDRVDCDVEDVREADVEEKEEKRDASEDDEGIFGGEIEFFEPGESDERWAERHEKEKERRRIFGGVEER